MKSITDTPIVILNFKTYLESTGKNALKLANSLQKVANETGINMMAAPQHMDIYPVSKDVDIPILTQHIDPIESGGHTGSVLLECANSAGAQGSLINHSEKRMKLADIDYLVKRTADLGMFNVICTNNIETSTAAASLSPDFIAVEPPELIGSGIPVSQAEPEVVEKTVEEVKRINSQVKVLCGAGISTGDDMKAALDLGSQGVLLASGIIMAQNPEKALMDLISKI